MPPARLPGCHHGPDLGFGHTGILLVGFSWTGFGNSPLRIHRYRVDGWIPPMSSHTTDFLKNRSGNCASFKSLCFYSFA